MFFETRYQMFVDWVAGCRGIGSGSDHQSDSKGAVIPVCERTRLFLNTDLKGLRILFSSITGLLAPILGVAFPPAFSAIPLVILIGRIRRQLLELPKGLSGSLAFWEFTILLIYYSMIWNKIAPTMHTGNPVHGRPPGKTIARLVLSGNRRRLENHEVS